MQAKATDYSNLVDITAEERARANKGKRKALRADLVRDENNVEQFLRFEARCTKKFGPAAGMFIRQLVFWEGKQVDPDGWIYKSRAEFEDEVGLSRRQQENARKVLKAAGALEEEDRLAAPHFNYKVMHYRVNLERLIEILDNPYSTLNQWKRGRRYTKNTSGQFERLAEEVLLDNTEPDHRHGSTEPEVRHGNTEQNHRLDNDEQNVRHGITEQEVVLDNTEQTTESTSESSTEGTSESSTENYFQKKSLLQSGENGFSSRPSPPPKHKKISQEPKSANGVNGSRQASFSDEPHLDAELLSEVKMVLGKPPYDNAAEMFEDYRQGRFKDDPVVIMQAVAIELGVTYFSEDLRRHISVAMRELETAS